MGSAYDAREETSGSYKPPTLRDSETGIHNVFRFPDFPFLPDYLQKQNGLKKGDRVAILLNRSPEFIISILAILKLGAIFIPIPSNHPSGRMLGIIEDADNAV